MRRLDGVWVELTPDLARALAQKSMVGIATSIREGRERTAARAAAMAYRRQEQALLMEEREAERRNRALWRRVKVKVPNEVAPERKPHRATRSGFLGGASPLPSYSGAIVDRLGRRNVFLRIRYYGRKTSRPGVGRRVAIYIYQGAVQNADGTVCLFSNVADTPEEAIAAMDLLEQVNREASVDAKLLFHLIANLPHQLTVDQMMEEARRFAEAQFGSRDLPYVVALHPPSAEGDQRNWHVHILASTRPMRRVGNQEWELGEQLRTEIDNPEAFRRMRELYAVIQTEVAQEAGLHLVYTALSNAARGLPNKPQEHLGGPLTDLVRRGEVVAANERNHATVVDGEQALLDERLRHDQEAGIQETAHVMRAAAPFTERAAAQEMASAVPGSVAISNLKHPPLTPAKQDRADHAAADVWPLATDTPASRSVLTAVADVPILAIAEPSVEVFPTAAPNSQAVLRWDPALAGEAALSPVLKKASPLPRIMPASRSSIPPAIAYSIAHAWVGSTTSAMAPLAPEMPASTLLATRSSGKAVGEPGLVPVADNAGRPHALSDPPPRQAPVVARLPDVPFVVPASKAVAGPALSRPPALQRSALTPEDVPRAIPTAADVSDAELNTIRRLIERARAEAKRRKAEREREAAALAAKREAEEAAERADLERLKVLDPFVEEFRRKGLSVPNETLAALGRDRDWERTMPVQRALAAMLDDQNARLDRMEHAADGTPPIAMVDGRPVPAAHLALDLTRSIERWSDHPAFRAMAAAFWPAPPPQTVSPAPVGGVLAAPAVVPPEDDVARSRRWAAVYRERLMVATDAAQRWDRNSDFIRSGEERVEAEPPTRAPVRPATLAARHLLDRGRGS